MSCTISRGPAYGERYLLSEDVAAFLAELREYGDDGSALVRVSSGWGGKLRRIEARVDPLPPSYADDEPEPAPAQAHLRGLGTEPGLDSRTWREGASPWQSWDTPAWQPAPASVDTLTGTVVQAPALPAGPDAEEPG